MCTENVSSAMVLSEAMGAMSRTHQQGNAYELFKAAVNLKQVKSERLRETCACSAATDDGVAQTGAFAHLQVTVWWSVMRIRDQHMVLLQWWSFTPGPDRVPASCLPSKS